MSYSIDANILLYAVNSEAQEHPAALDFIRSRAAERDLLCLTWPAIMAFQRIATHPAIFSNPLSPEQAWGNISKLLALPRSRCLSEDPGFEEDYAQLTGPLQIRGNLVPDAHIATILHQHGVGRIYTADSDFRKFDFLEVINPLL
ncbi:MAG TPA: TA system VapC family ribonuclease toxin [Opitutales bacterium]|nr:TA system VapC family ribonuclease toxin [Opitutales bacterium]